MLHEPAPQDTFEDHAAEYKSKTGIKLFIAYSIAFGIFVLTNTFAPEIMGIKILFGLNLAIIFGFVLIILAVILGLIYNILCSVKERELNE